MIDASVAVKWFLPELHAAAARRIVKGRRDLLAPDLILAEVGNVLWKKFRRAELSAEAARGILQDFKRFPLQIYPTKNLLDPAWDLAERFSLSVYDSLYLALALGHACPLVTADQKFYDALKHGPLRSVLTWVEHVR